MEENYYYIVNKRSQIVCELRGDKASAEDLAKLSGCTLYDHFPYEECGYEDPFNFIAEWAVYSHDNGRLYVQLDPENRVSIVEGV